MEYFIACCLILASYLLGSIPFGYIIGKLKGKDITKLGSGNIGSTNAIRTLGKKFGLLTALLDVLKGAIIILLVYLLEATTKWNNPIIIRNESIYILYGIPAAFGHCYSPFMHFKGGKAVATSLGILISAIPYCSIVALVIFTITLLIWGYVSISSSLATICVVISSFLIYGLIYNLWYTSLFTIILATLILIKHIPNYKRLLNGTESNFKKKHAKSTN